MRSFTIITLSIFFIQTFGQDIGVYQRDSVYNVNKVKARLWYSGQEKELTATTYYNREGKLVRFQLEPQEDGTQVSTYYFYNQKKRLAAMIDTIRNIDNNSIEIARYNLELDSNALIKLTRYHSDGLIDYVKKFSNNRNMETLYRYSNGRVIENSTTEYKTELHEERSYGWEKRNGKKSAWDHRFKYEFENGSVKSYVWFEGKRKKETVKFFYDEKGLLIKIDDSTPDFFEYTYY